MSTSMGRRNQYRDRVELLQGTLDMLILQTLQWGPQHGYGIMQALRVNSGDVLQVETGSLYPALHRLDQERIARLGQCEQRDQVGHRRARGPPLHELGTEELAHLRDDDRLQLVNAGILMPDREDTVARRAFRYARCQVGVQ